MTQNRGNRHDKIVIHVPVEVEDLIPSFLKKRRKDIRLMREALARQDYESIRVIGHDMKGMGSG